MTDEDLTSLRAIADAATPAPWLLSETSGCVETSQLGGDGIVYGGHLWKPDFDEDDSPEARVKYLRRDGAFIVAARSAVPALLDEIERLRSRPWLRLRELGFEVDETEVRRGSAMEREIVALRTALSEAIGLFDAVWCPGHAPKQAQLDRIAELKKLVQP